GPSVRNPPTEIKKRLLHLMDQLGIDSADIGLPGASERARTEIVALAKETTMLKRLRPNMAARTHPADVRGGIEAARQARGAIRICASDTVGHATPEGVRNLLTFLRKDVIRGRDVKLDYHGHNDRGFGTINALAATAIADRVHGCALGIGERVGNTSMDQLL